MVEIIVRINPTLNSDERDALKMFTHYVQNNTLKVPQIIKYLRSFLYVLKNELISNNYLEYLRDTRVWICYNLIRVLNRHLIDPIASNDVCDTLAYYYHILDIYINLDEILVYDDNGKISWWLRQFFVIDIDLKKKCYSKCDSVNYILNTYNKEIIDTMNKLDTVD